MTAEPVAKRRFPGLRRGKTTSSRLTSLTGRSRSRSRTARSTPTARSSIRTRACSSTGSSRTTSLRASSPRSGTPSSSATRSWSTATPGRSKRSSSAATGSASSTAASRASSSSTSTPSQASRCGRSATKGGFLAAPVNITADHGNRLLMGLAERADVIVDFTNVPVGNYVLGNVGPDEPFGGGVPDVDFPAADPGTTGQVMQFRVVPARRCRRLDAAAVPPAARDHTAACGDGHAAAGADRGRQARVVDDDGDEVEGPVAALLGTVRCRSVDGPRVDGPGDREPGRRRDRGLGDLQHHRRRPPDAHPRDRRSKWSTARVSS